MTSDSVFLWISLLYKLIVHGKEGASVLTQCLTRRDRRLGEILPPGWETASFSKAAARAHSAKRVGMCVQHVTLIWNTAKPRRTCTLYFPSCWEKIPFLPPPPSLVHMLNSLKPCRCFEPPPIHLFQWETNWCAACFSLLKLLIGHLWQCCAAAPSDILPCSALWVAAAEKHAGAGKSDQSRSDDSHKYASPARTPAQLPALLEILRDAETDKDGRKVTVWVNITILWTVFVILLLDLSRFAVWSSWSSARNQS